MLPMFASVYIWHDWYNSNINITFVLRFVITQCLTQMQIHTALILTILCNVVSTSRTLDVSHYRHVILNTWYYNYIRDCIVKLNFKFPISQENVLFQQLYSIIIYHFTYRQHLTLTMGRMQNIPGSRKCIHKYIGNIVTHWVLLKSKNMINEVYQMKFTWSPYLKYVSRIRAIFAKTSCLSKLYCLKFKYRDISLAGVPGRTY